METVLLNLALVEQLGSKLGLKLNCQKSELSAIMMLLELQSCHPSKELE